MSTERTISSSRIYEGKFIGLRLDTVRLSQGRNATREVVEHRGAAAIIPILSKNLIIMVRQYRYATGEVLLEIPAGTLKDGEDISECAARELEEETGYRASRMEKLMQFYLAPGYSTEVIHVFVATDLVKGRKHTDVDESIRTIKVPLRKLVALIHSGKVRDSKTICGILAFWSKSCGN